MCKIYTWILRYEPRGGPDGDSDVPVVGGYSRVDVRDVSFAACFRDAVRADTDLDEAGASFFNQWSARIAIDARKLEQAMKEVNNKKWN